MASSRRSHRHRTPASMKAQAPLSRLRSFFRSATADYSLGILFTAAAALVSHRDTSCPAKAGNTVILLISVGIGLVGAATFLLAGRLTVRGWRLPFWACLVVSAAAMVVYFWLTVIVLLMVQPGGFFDCVSEGSMGL